MKYKPVSNYIGDELISGSNGKLDVLSPIDGSVISQVSLSIAADVDKAAQAAKAAFPAWSGMPIKERVQIFFRYKRLLEENMDELTKLVH
jgi:malonate-semialdehyde dehydrogenase (acetylating)/methylmalonate-semialdehyde dehydrogenase